MTIRRRLILGLISGLALADVAGAAYLWAVWQARAEQRVGGPGVGAQMQAPHKARPPGPEARRPLP